MTVITQAVVRHLVAALGASQLVNENELQQIAGAVVTLLMIGWSIYEKRSRHANP